MRFKELTKAQQNRVRTEIAKAFMENGETLPMAAKCAEEVIKDLDEANRFYLVDYSLDEDGSDIRVEY